MPASQVRAIKSCPMVGMTATGSPTAGTTTNQGRVGPFPEAGKEPGDVEDVGRRGQKERVEALGRHCPTAALRSVRGNSSAGKIAASSNLGPLAKNGENAGCARHVGQS